VSAQRIFDLIYERSELVCLIAAWKWIKQLPIRDRLRETSVIERALRHAAMRDLAPAPIRRLFELQMDCARDLQNKLHRGWKRHGFSPSTEIPSLELELRPKLDGLTERLVDAVDGALAALSAPNFAEDWAAQASGLESVGWSGARIRELLLILESSSRCAPRYGSSSSALDESASGRVILQIGEEM